jgi:hypothetical protein
MMKKSLYHRGAAKVVDNAYIQQIAMFREIWKRRTHTQKVEYLGEALSIYFSSHSYKEKHPEACLDPEYSTLTLMNILM